MTENTVTTFDGRPIPVYEPESGMPAHVTDFGSYRDNLDDVLAVYDDDKYEFFMTPVSSEKFPEIKERWDESCKELIATAEGLIRMYGISNEDRAYALRLMNYATRDCDRRKRCFRVESGAILAGKKGVAGD